MKPLLVLVLLLTGCRLFGDGIEETTDMGTDTREQDVRVVIDMRPDADVSTPDLAPDVAPDLSLDMAPDATPDMAPCPLDAFAPIGWWTLDLLNATGGYDNLGSDQTIGQAQILGAPEVISTGSIRGNALRFDGIDDGVYINHASGFEIEEGTISVWVNAPTYSGAEQFRGILTKDGQDQVFGGHSSIFLETTNAVNYRTQTTVDTDQTLSNPLGPNVWTHVVATFGPTGKRLYLNGVLVNGSVATGSWFSIDQNVQNRQPIGIGFSTWVANEGVIFPAVGFLEATIDEVMVFDRALVDAEVFSLYTAIQSDCR